MVRTLPAIDRRSGAWAKCERSAKMPARFTSTTSRKVRSVQIQRIDSARRPKPKPTRWSSACFEDAPLAGAAAEVDAALRRRDSRLIERKEFTGTQLRNRCRCWCPWARRQQALVVGLGQREKFDAGAAFRCSAAAARAPGRQAARAAWPSSRRRLAGRVDRKRRVPARSSAARARTSIAPRRTAIRSTRWPGPAAATQAIASGRILGESVNLTRRLVNEPADEIYPETFAHRAAEVAEQNGLEIEIWDAERLAAERCGSLLAVAKGSSRPARLVILRYRGGRQDAPTLAIVGKGVTFDSGGLSLKPPEGMLTMKCDMAGAATMVGAMQAIAQLKLPVNVIGLAGLVENMTGPAAMKLGDVLHGPQRPHDRSAQHRRRRPAGAGRRAVAWPSTWARPRSSTWPR